jgi:two-component system response regulator MprA
MDSSLKVPKVEKEAKICLVIERDPFYKVFIENFFRKVHVEIEFVQDGVSALKRVKTRKPDLLISEALLPKVDGLALCQYIRSDPKLSDLPIIIFSILEIEEDAVESGANFFLLKPFHEREFAKSVSRFLPIQIKEANE